MRVRYASGLRARTRSGDVSPEPPPFCHKRRVVRRVSRQREREDWPSLAQRHLRAIPVIAVAAALAAAVLLVTCTPAQAAGSGMPWEAPLQRILESIEGPVAKVVAVVTIIVTGLSLAFGDMGGGFRRLVQIVFGLSIAFAATSFFLSFFSFAGGAMID
jgi:type IV secretory pathway VirB2 component (pilin)